MARSASPNDRLVVKQLWAAYGGSAVVRDVSLRVASGEAVALLGRNGAGKTTTLMTIAGALTPQRGSVQIDGVATSGLAAYQVARLGVSLVPQGRRIFESLSVRENLMLGGGDPRSVYRLFPILSERSGQSGSSLSGGEQQMLAIGRALLTGPKILLMDEPSEGLAPQLVRRIGELIAELRQQRELSIVIAEQNLALALNVAERVYVLERGEVVHEGPAEQFRGSRDLQRRYLGV